MQDRAQRTIRHAAATSGIGFLTGADVSLRFLAAPVNHGIAFQRTDCAGSAPVPALIENAVPRRRRTAIASGSVVVEMTEHVMAALAGLRIDNCLVQLNAPEPPGNDGSSREFTDVLLNAGIVEQDETREVLVIENPLCAHGEDGGSDVAVKTASQPGLTISYQLDYGSESPISRQNYTVEVTPETFVKELAFARTFVLETEVQALRDEGYGSRTTAKDLLVFGENGVIDNQLRVSDECARHKVLDCIGDLALIGCDIQGHVTAHRSGHCLNREIVSRLKLAYPHLHGTYRRHAA